MEIIFGKEIWSLEEGGIEKKSDQVQEPNRQKDACNFTSWCGVQDPGDETNKRCHQRHEEGYKRAE
jgi:hypothetical protein